MGRSSARDTGGAAGTGTPVIEGADDVTMTVPPKGLSDNTGTSPTAMSKESQPVLPKAELERGASVGRYVVYEVLGVGGMGIVYKAYDPELDRGVALKVLAIKSRDDVEATAARARHEREARILAQLAHPNVVAVHDVGRLDGDLFIAMELVEGQNLKEWRREEDRSVAEVLEMFCAAGRGLAAAHRAGLVHRDFKPSNVLVGNDGRVRVADFGLARTTESDGVAGRGFDSGVLTDDSISIDPDEVSSAGDWASGNDTRSGFMNSSVMSEPLTRAGAIMGTPQYMAPEQFRGDKVEAAADQFSFCVSLYEALYGERPFRARDFASLRRRVLAGRISKPPTDVRVPGWLRKIVLRGLSALPEERYPSMDELLVDLQRDPSAARRRVLAGAGIAALAGLAVIGFGRGGEAAALCQGAKAELEQQWNGEGRAAMKRAFVATGMPYAEDLYTRVDAVLDTYGKDWVAMRTSACEATHVKGIQSERLLDLRMRCLDSRLVELGALSSLLAQDGGGETIDKAMNAALSLPTLERCGDEEALTAAVPPPDDPATRQRVDDLRRRLADVRARESTGQYKQGLEMLAPLAGEASGVTYEPLHAEMDLLAGRLHLGAGDFQAADSSLRSAVVRGARAKDDALVADAWIQFGEVLAQRGEYDLALEMVLGTKMAVARAGDTPLQRGLLERLVGGVHRLKGDYDVASQHLKEAVSLTESVLGESHPIVATSVNALASNFYVQGKYAEARPHYERALAIREKTLGPDHPLAAALVFNLGMMAAAEPDYSRSEAMLRRALATFQNVHGEEHPHTAAAYGALGMLLQLVGRYAEAEDLLRRSVVIREKFLGDDHPTTASSLVDLAVVLVDAERFEEAEELAQRSLAVFEKKLGDDHPNVGYARYVLADALVRQEKFAAAQPLYESAIDLLVAKAPKTEFLARSRLRYGQALALAGNHTGARAQFAESLAVYEQIVAKTHPGLSDPLAGLGSSHLALGEPQQAIPLLERALQIRSDYPMLDPVHTAAIEFDLARALWPSEDRRSLAELLAKEARSTFAGDPRPSARELFSRADAWLRRPAARR